MQAPRLAGWNSEAGKEAYLAAYDSAMGLWPVPFESRQITTRFGSTPARTMVRVMRAIRVSSSRWTPSCEGARMRWKRGGSCDSRGPGGMGNSDDFAGDRLGDSFQPIGFGQRAGNDPLIEGEVFCDESLVQQELLHDDHTLDELAGDPW